MACRQKIGILWFRSDLRLHDNSTLNTAIDLINQSKINKVLPFFCFDVAKFEGKSREANIPRAGVFRRNFEIESVNNLKENLIKTLGSNLYISYGQPEIEIMKLVELLNQEENSSSVHLVLASKEVCTEEITLENRLSRMLTEKNITLKLVWDSSMIHLDDLPVKVSVNGDLKNFPDVFTHFRKSVEIREGTYNVRSSRAIGKDYKLPTFELKSGWNEMTMPLKEATDGSTRSAVLNMHGGEAEGQKRMKHYFFNTQGLENYKSTRNGLIGTEYSSKLSMWLAHGCLSPRDIYEQVKIYESKNGPSEGTKCMVFELLWRDFFKFIAKKYGSILFRLNGANEGANAAKYQWKKDMNLFEKWCQGETGYPFVDANMKELNETGFMSNRGRQNVASFLTKDLELDWRFGAEYFESMLIDHDPASNWGNWQYAAGVGTDPRQDRYFNTIKQAYDYDSAGDYAKLWLPNLSNVSNAFIYCPFRMSSVDQKISKCILGKDYPEPIVKMKFEWKPNSRNKVNKFATNQANSSRNKKF